MIKTLRLHGFKAFKDTGDIEIKPITVLAGPNSSGKTSIIQSLLLLKQSLDLDSFDVGLNLDGRFVQFSQFRELAFGKPSPRDSRVGYEIRVTAHAPRDALSEYFPSLGPSDAREIPIDGHIEFVFRQTESKNGQKQVVLESFRLQTEVKGDPGPELLVSRYGSRMVVRSPKGVHDTVSTYRGYRVADILVRNFLPWGYMLKSCARRKKGRGEYLPVNFDAIFSRPISALSMDLSENLDYLGPLREAPKRAYLHSGRTFPEIGQRGEYAAQILWLEKNRKVDYVCNLGGRPEKVPLLEAVNQSFSQIGVRQLVNVSSQKSIMYQLLFGISGNGGSRRDVTIADVGFGVSQLLPIVVMALRADRDALLLLEQPEIHLHPRLQANLADFFLQLAASGKRVLVETHSDHFINRLRRRVAEDSSDTVKDEISILFVQPSDGDSGSTIEPLRVDRYGVIENWPPDFLPETSQEAKMIFQAGLDKRRVTT